MKNRWLRLWRSRPRLSRGWRTVRNLAAVLICLCVLWARAGYPLPTAELEFRRLERQNLLPPSELQGVFRRENQWVVVGLREDGVLFSEDRALDRWPRSGAGAALVPIGRWVWTELDVMAVDVPQGTASARLDMALDCWYYLRGDGWSASGEKGGTLGENMDGWKRWAKDFHIEGELLKEGGILFRVPVEDHESMEYELLRLLAKQNTYRQSAKVRGLNCHMQAVFYGQDGRELGRAALSTLEDGETSSVSG